MRPIEKSCIHIVARGLKSGRQRQRIIADLTEIGISNELAEDAYVVIESGLKNGVNAAVTNGLSSKGCKKGENPLYDAAFDEGCRALKAQTRLFWFRRFIIGLVIISAFAAFVFLIKRL